MGRRLSESELTLARSVFGDAVRLDCVRIHGGGFGRFAVTIGSNLFMPTHVQETDFSAANPGAQALLIHELVHVWQFQTRPLWTLTSWAATALGGGYGPGLPGYRYTLPLAPFAALNLEQQASVIEHAFLIRRGLRNASTPPGARFEDLTAGAPFVFGD